MDGENLQPHHVHQIGYLPEERGLYKSMKVGEQVLYLAQLKGMSLPEAKKKLGTGLKNLKFLIGGIRKYKNFLKVWLKRCNLL